MARSSGIRRPREGPRRYLEAILASGGEVELVRATAKGNNRERVSLTSHRRGFPEMTLTNGSTHEFLELTCAFALAVCSPELAPYETWMFAEDCNDRCFVKCDVLNGDRILAVKPEGLVGTEILRWFEPRAEGLCTLVSYIPCPPQARAIVRARRAVGDFFLEKRIPIPEGAPDWLVGLGEGSAENSSS